MHAIRRLGFGFFVLWGAWAPAFAAGPVPDFGGSWECRLPGQPLTNTPDIVWIQHAASSDPHRTIVEVDGFAHEMAGSGELAAAHDGWSSITPERGPSFFVRRTASPRETLAPAMELKRTETGPVYRCLRLPLG